MHGIQHIIIIYINMVHKNHKSYYLIIFQNNNKKDFKSQKYVYLNFVILLQNYINNVQLVGVLYYVIN